jgi:hypothetical protein
MHYEELYAKEDQISDSKFPYHFLRHWTCLLAEHVPMEHGEPWRKFLQGEKSYTQDKMNIIVYIE